MAAIIPKKAVLQTAATDTYSKDGAAMDQARPLIAKLDVTKRKPPKAGKPSDSGKTSP